ncbi:mucoidy inhibitor MuiA family protein [bacterium]|nr:mucoidy inhibitor MuiA family protein [bacterium]
MVRFEAPITRVTLLEDRAYVRRQAELELPQGRSRWKLTNVSPLLVDKTLTAQLPGSARVVQVSLDRSLPPLPSSPEVADSGPDLERQRQLRELREKTLLNERELFSAQSLFEELTREIGKQVAWGVDETAAWEEQLQELAAWKEQLVEERHRLDMAQEALSVQPAPVLPVLTSNTETTDTDILVEIDSPAAQTVGLRLEYSLPCACWRPSHRAVLTSDGLEMNCEATCWQHTGEDWNEVELVFSTQRFSLGNEPPQPQPEFLQTRKKSSEVVVAQRDQDIAELSNVLQGGLEKLAPAERASEVPGIDDGGQVIHLRAPQKSTIPSHGKPVRVALSTFKCQVELENILMAEVCSEVMQRSRQTNSSDSPLLAGPVDLIRESGLIGRGQLDYIAAAEPFSLGWGPQTSLRVLRKVNQGQEEKDDLLGGWTRIKHSVELTLSNLSSESHTVQVIERIPVSELKQVEVIFDAKTSSPGGSPDANGFITWKLELGARARHHLQLNYSLRKRKEVVTA